MSRDAVNLRDTIFALTTGSLPSGVAILKISGRNAFPIGEKLFALFQKKPGVTLGTFSDYRGDFVDKGLLLSFVGPNSHTGEDVVEFHLHGSKAIVSTLEYSIEQLGGRRASPGEFSYRAFVNGKTTVEELENLGDIFATSQEEGLKRIYGRRDGSLEKKISELRQDLIKVQAILDTAVDFADEYSNVVSSASTPLQMTTHAVEEIIQRYSTLKKSPDLPKLVIAGRPNAGKSSFFNAILCRYRAIVHSEPGTTRDVIEEEVLLSGKRWMLVDTAGVRQTTSSSEKQGIEIGADYLSGASFWVLMVDGREGLAAEDFELLEKYQSIPHRIVWNKRDLAGWKLPAEEWILMKTSGISAETGEGLVDLVRVIEVGLKQDSKVSSLPTPTRVQAMKLEAVLVELRKLREGLEKNEPPEYLAEINRQSIQRLESVVGEVLVDDVLDRVFSEFCIGK